MCKGGVIQSARIGLTGASTHAMRLSDVEKALAGKHGIGGRDRRGGERSPAADIADLNADLHASADIAGR